MIITSLEGSTNMENVISYLRAAKNVILFMRDEKGEHRFFHSDLGEDEFLMAIILMFRNNEVYNFFKLLILDIEKCRQQPELSNDFSYKVLEYIRKGNLKNPDLNI